MMSQRQTALGEELRLLFVEALSSKPFPAAECRKIGLSDHLHGELVLFLANIAGMASRGEMLFAIDETTRSKFLDLSRQGFFERYPMLRERIAPQSTPELAALLEQTERARRLIRQVLTV